MFCAKCGKPIADDSKFCVHCGAKVTSVEMAEPHPEPKAEAPEIIPTASSAKQAVTENESVRSIVEEKLESTATRTTMESIIETHCEYYLPEFEKVENGSDTKFKWAAFLFGPMFCIYRKCWDLFMQYFLIPYIILGVGLICSAIAEFTFSFAFGIAALVLSGVFAIWLFVNSIRVGLNFNKDYYEHCKKEMASATPKCGTSIGAAIGAAAVYAAVIGGVVALTVGVGIFGGSNKIDDFDYDAYYEDFYDEFGNGSSDYSDYGYGDSDVGDYDNAYGYAAESIYQPMMSDAVTYSMNGGSEAETPRLIIGQIDGEEYGVFYAWNYEAEMPVIVLEGQSEWAGNGYYRLYDSYHDGYLEYSLSGDESRCVIDVTQYGDVGSWGNDYSGEYMDVNGYMEYYYG